MKKRLQLLVEHKQSKSNSQSVVSKEQQTRLQNAIIKQLQEALEKQTEEIGVLI